MKSLIFFIACALLAGCDYSVPLINTPTLKIDSSLIGCWQQTHADGQIERLLILPLGTNEYLISYPADSKNAMYARACHGRSADLDLIQLNWIGTARGKLPENQRTFQFVTYALSQDTLSIKLLNADLVNRNVTTAAELTKAIAANHGNPALFRDAMIFKKTNPAPGK